MIQIKRHDPNPCRKCCAALSHDTFSPKVAVSVTSPRKIKTSGTTDVKASTVAVKSKMQSTKAVSHQASGGIVGAMETKTVFIIAM